MMEAPEIDARYFERRAVTELRMASEAPHPKSANAHRTLASMYLNLAGSETAKRQRFVLSN